MMTRHGRVLVLAVAPLAGAALGAFAVGCTSSSNNTAPPGEAGVDAGEANDATIVDGGESEASAEAAGHTIKLTWQVASGPPLTTEGLDGGGAGAGGAVDASSDAPSTDGSSTDAASDAAVDAGSDAEGEPDAGPDAAASGGPPDANAGDGGYQSLAGVSVCVYQNSAIPCVTTDDGGIFTISGLPAGSDIALTFKKDGYVPVLTAVFTPNTDIDGLSSAGSPLVMGSSTVPSITPVPVDIKNKGLVIVAAVIPGSSGKPTDATGDVGAKISLSPMTGNGPYYLDRGNSAIVPSATSMVYEGAVYFNLDPGDYVVTIDDPNHTCSPLSPLVGLYGYPAPPTSVKFPILAGYSTSPVGFYCTAKSTIVNTADAN